MKKAFITQASPLSSSVNRTQLVLYLPILNAYFIFVPTQACFLRLWGGMGEIGLGTCAQQEMKEVSELWMRTRETEALSCPHNTPAFHVAYFLHAQLESPLWKIKFHRKLSMVPLSSLMEAKDGKISDFSQLLNHFQARFWRKPESPL